MNIGRQFNQSDISAERISLMKETPEREFPTRSTRKFARKEAQP